MTDYQGLVTRAIAFAVDAAIINLLALLVGVGLGLALSIVSVSDDLEVVLLACGGVAFVIWSIAYFVTFWSTTGQTPGDRVMQIRVCREDGDRVRPRQAVLRFGALLLAALPLFAGFVPVLFDDRRRGVHDMLARTVVVGVSAEPRSTRVPRASSSPVPP
jgi:uncharacterized RDD family membrane protein YckC